METATALRDFLKTGVIRNAVNFLGRAGRVSAAAAVRRVGETSAHLLGQMGEARIEGLNVRYYGEPANATNPLIVNAALVGLFQRDPHRHGHRVNARAVARRVASRSPSRRARAAHLPSLISLKLGPVAASAGSKAPSARLRAAPRAPQRRPVEAPLAGTTLLMMNNDQPGAIGQVGTILGHHDINIANFALRKKRNRRGGAANVDEPADKKIGENVMKEIRALKPVRNAWLCG